MGALTAAFVRDFTAGMMGTVEGVEEASREQLLVIQQMHHDNQAIRQQNVRLLQDVEVTAPQTVILLIVFNCM